MSIERCDPKSDSSWRQNLNLPYLNLCIRGEILDCIPGPDYIVSVCPPASCSRLDRRLMGNGDEADSNHQGLGPCLSWGAREESKYVVDRPWVLERAAPPVLHCPSHTGSCDF